MMKTLTIAFAVLTFAVGCSAEPGGLDDTQSGLVELVGLELRDTGVVVLSRDWITREEQRAIVAARLAGSEPNVKRSALITYDRNCSNNSALWLFDQANYAGNQLCFSGSGTVDLATIKRGCSGSHCPTWANSIASYLTHAEFGTFINNYIADLGGPVSYPTVFCANQSAATVNWVVAGTDLVDLPSTKPAACP